MARDSKNNAPSEAKQIPISPVCLRGNKVQQQQQQQQQ
jgi:hypothetical protein